jgi:hypothetical protein
MLLNLVCVTVLRHDHVARPHLFLNFSARISVFFCFSFNSPRSLASFLSLHPYHSVLIYFISGYLQLLIFLIVLLDSSVSASHLSFSVLTFLFQSLYLCLHLQPPFTFFVTISLSLTKQLSIWSLDVRLTSILAVPLTFCASVSSSVE